MPKKRLFYFCLTVICVSLLCLSCTKKEEPADLVLMQGKIVTVDEIKPEVEAIAVRGDTVVALGTNTEIEPYIGDSTKVIDLKGNLAIPGFIDAHAHFTGIGQAKLGLELMPVKNWDQVIAMVAEAVKGAQPGAWISGRGWHQEKWDITPEPNVDGLPLHYELSKVSPDNPVLLSHASGHASFANAKAMELAGITRETPEPEGGEIVKDAKGNPIGMFRETAQRLLRDAFYTWHETLGAALIAAERQKIIELADQECLAKGITSVHDPGSPFETIDLFKETVEQGKLGVRLYVMIRDSNERIREKIGEYRIMGMGNNHLTVRSIKRSIDGALGPHGAWLLEPYESLPTSVGLNVSTVESVTETAQIAIENDFQLNVHCIGDRANRETLDIFEEAFTAHPDKKDQRWRIEHAQHLHPSDLPRFAQLGVIPSMQGIHCTSDGPYVLKRLGEQRAEEGAYVWQKLMDTGVVICNGTDAPVEDVDPIPCFYATVTRMMKNGQTFYSDQKMSREEALRSYTINCAYASFQEDILGSLTLGKLADITVLSKDIMTVPDEEILDTEVLYTIVGGKVLYQK